jgi:hypothetical protein
MRYTQTNIVSHRRSPSTFTLLIRDYRHATNTQQRHNAELCERFRGQIWGHSDLHRLSAEPSSWMENAEAYPVSSRVETSLD